ncbi:hypothetical protein [Streptomyces fildesensis]|uniref:hypothetical protein n=1 Tax=Streptomyces fildesensis TaxID=375757 RepID=UPI0027DE14A0|nr:hypothetical protein [Streptomyces fildesensis]
MSALNVEPESHSGYGWDDLVRIWEETDVPEGCTVEIIEGTSPWHHRTPMTTTALPIGSNATCTR